MKHTALNIALAALGLGIGAPGVHAQTTAPSTPPPPSVIGPVVAVETTTISGKVAAIDNAKRLVAIQGEKGRVVTMYVGPNVRNFENLKPGDLASIRFSEARSLAIAKGGTSEIRTKIEADAAKMAPPGGKPGMSAMERTTIVANVFNIDRERGILTLRGTDGVPVDIRVSDKQALQQINKDDQVVIGYSHAAAIAIEPGAPKR